jgi:hypothetical protein
LAAPVTSTHPSLHLHSSASESIEWVRHDFLAGAYLPGWPLSTSSAALTGS